MCSVLQVAKQFCEKRNWEATNLELQKLLYIAQVFSLGLRDRPLFNSTIQAWQYGPVILDLYHEFKVYGRVPIPKTAFPSDLDSCSDEDKVFIDNVAELTKNLKDWQLVGLTHRKGTAWDKNHKTGTFHTEIPISDMTDEFNNVWRGV